MCDFQLGRKTGMGASFGGVVLILRCQPHGTLVEESTRSPTSFFWPHCVAPGTSPTRDRTHAPCSGSMES